MSLNMLIPWIILLLGVGFGFSDYWHLNSPEFYFSSFINVMGDGDRKTDGCPRDEFSGLGNLNGWCWQFFEGFYVKRQDACEVWYLSELEVVDDLYSVDGFIETSKGRGYLIENNETGRVSLCFEGQPEPALSIDSFYVNPLTGIFCIRDQTGLTYRIPEETPYRRASLVNMQTGELVEISSEDIESLGDWEWSLSQHGVCGQFTFSSRGDEIFCLSREGDFIEMNRGDYRHER